MSDVSSKPDVDRLPWHPFIGVVVVVGLFVLSQLVGGLVVGLIGAPLGLDINSTLAQFLYIVLAETLTVAGLIWFLKSRGKTLAVLGFGRPKPLHVGIGLISYPLYMIGYVALVSVVTKLYPALNVDQKQQLGFDSVHGVVALSMTFISLVILPPLVEELMVRGMLFTSLRSRLRFWLAALLTSVVFGSAHLLEGGKDGLLWIAALDTFALSIVLCWLREKTGSLWPGITLHALKNGIAFVSLYIIVVR